MFKELLNRRVVKVLLSVLFISGLTNVVPAQAVTLTPFTCSPGFYQVSNTGSGAIYSSSISNTGVLTFTKAPSATIIGSMNAIGYNTADNFIYGVVADKLYKIDATGSETLVNGTGVITGALPGSPGSGDFIAPNKLMVYGASGKTTFFVIDVTTLVSTAVNFTTVGTVGPVTGAWDFTTQGNYAYGMSSDGKNLIRMDLTTVLNGGTSETVTSYAVNAATTAQAPNTNTAPTTGGGYGAAYSDFVGNVYFFNNSDSKAFQITAASLAGAPAPKSILMGGKASSPTLAGPNDGASCPKAASAYAPITVTANASSVTLTSAQLNGSVNPQTAGTSVTTTGSFCYTTNPHTDASGNLDTGCTWVTASSPSSGSIPVGSTPVSMSVTISGLTAGITYYFQAKGSNASGDSYGVVKSFTSDFTLTYDANGATSGSVPTQQIGTGNVTVAGNTSALIKTGATFGGWYTNAAGTGGTLYSPSSIYNLTTNTTLYAKWNVVSYTLTFNANGGSGSLSNITGSGDKSLPNYTPGITVPGSGANVFGGWNTKADGTGITYSVGETYTLAADATLYAKWNSANFTLTYQGDSVTTGSAPIAQTGNGALVVQDNVRGLAKSGQTFVGWVDTATNTNYLAGDTYNLTSNSVLTARWATTLYSLSYNANGATGGVTPPNESTTGTVGVASNDGNLTRNGYTFGGWALCSGGGAVSTVNVTANVSLCAIWTGITYTLTYNVNTSSGGTGTPPASENVTVPDTSVVLDLDTGTMSATGKSFAGWSRNTSGTGPSYSPGDSFELTTNTTLYAKWVTNVYTLIYNANGGSNAPSPTVGSGVMVLEDGSNMTPPSGKQFDGWNTKADGTGVDFLGGDNYDLRGNITLYAKWADQLFTLTYDGNNQDSGTAPLQAHGYGDVAVSDNDYGLAVTGKTFDGWNTRPDGTGFDFPAGTSYNLRADVTLYAQYATTLYTLTFDSNTAGATSAVTGFVPDPIVAAGTIILPGNSGLLTTATDKFTGWWNTKADGTGVTYTPGDGFELGADTTLFAKWLPNSTTLYTLTFDGNGADGGFVPDPIAGNGIIVLPYNSGNLTRTGYTFGGWNGWSTEPNGGGVTYFPGDYFDLKANHTLYAMWDDTTYHLSYRANFSPVVGSVPNSQDGFGDIILPGNVGGLVNSGKLFAGWQVDHNGTPDASVLTPKAIPSRSKLIPSWMQSG